MLTRSVGNSETPDTKGKGVSGVSNQTESGEGKGGNRNLSAQSVWVLSHYARLATFASAWLADLPISLAILSVSVILTSVA